MKKLKKPKPPKNVTESEYQELLPRITLIVALGVLLVAWVLLIANKC